MMMSRQTLTIFIAISILLASCSMPALPGLSGPPPTSLAPSQTPEKQKQEITAPASTTEAPVDSATSLPTDASGPTQTPVVNLQATKSAQTPEPSLTPTIDTVIYPFRIQIGTPVNTVNFIKPDAGCNWMGVGGQVFYLDGRPADRLVVQVSGTLEGNNVLLLGLTGDAPVLGEGGFELTLADHPIASQNSLHIQLFDLTGKVLSEPVAFDTVAGSSACEKNLTIINFTSIVLNTNYEYRFPLMFKNGTIR